jgi:hypothetical protein
MDRLFRPSPSNSRSEDIAKDPMILADHAIVNLTHAEHVSGYTIKVRFSDGAERVIDFESFLKQSTNPHICKYLAIEKFIDFQIRNGDLVWNDYDLCFPIADLYEGRI